MRRLRTKEPTHTTTVIRQHNTTHHRQRRRLKGAGGASRAIDLPSSYLLILVHEKHTNQSTRQTPPRGLKKQQPNETPTDRRNPIAPMNSTPQSRLEQPLTGLDVVVCFVWLGLDLDGGLRSGEHAAGGVFCHEGAEAPSLSFRLPRGAVAPLSHYGVLGRAFLNMNARVGKADGRWRGRVMHVQTNTIACVVGRASANRDVRWKAVARGRDREETWMRERTGQGSAGIGYPVLHHRKPVAFRGILLYTTRTDAQAKPEKPATTSRPCERTEQTQRVPCH